MSLSPHRWMVGAWSPPRTNRVNFSLVVGKSVFHLWTGVYGTSNMNVYKISSSRYNVQEEKCELQWWSVSVYFMMYPYLFMKFLCYNDTFYDPSFLWTMECDVFIENVYGWWIWNIWYSRHHELMTILIEGYYWSSWTGDNM